MAIYNISIPASLTINTNSAKEFKKSSTALRRAVSSTINNLSTDLKHLINLIPADMDGNTPLSWGKIDGFWEVITTVDDLRRYNGSTEHSSHDAFKSAMVSLENGSFPKYCESLKERHEKRVQIEELLLANGLSGKKSPKTPEVEPELIVTAI